MNDAERAATDWDPPTQNHDPAHLAFARECYAEGYETAMADRLSRPGELFMDVLKSAQGVDHPILDEIVSLTADNAWSTWVVEREAERLVFDEPSTPGQRFEIVVRPIDGDEDEEPTC